jgi:hypothetical protein
MHDDLREASFLAGSMHRRKLGKVRPRAHNVKELHLECTGS